MFVVFAYSLLVGSDIRYAVAVFPADRTTTLLGGGETQVRYTYGESWHDFRAERETVQYLPAEQAMGYASTLVARYIEEGTIAGSPIPRPPPTPSDNRPIRFPGAK